ncbi:MAG: prealbumin-like fold domain-containing protein [Chloroflexi bacterium]|nr:prealbumin-like fold domain-containing protein [Chloroflexota bacterium]
MKTPALVVLLAAVAVALVIACGGEEEVPHTAGIEGQVLLGPMCPVVREGSPCPDQPYQATIDVWNADRTEKVRTFTTDPEGRFRVALAPGDYYIEPQPPDGRGPPTPIPQTVTVPPNAFVQITIEYDSGIR